MMNENHSADSAELERELYDSLQARRRPEDVARLVGQFLEAALTGKERKILQSVARGAGRGLGYSSMMDDFARPTGMQGLVAASARPFLFPAVPAPRTRDCDEPEIMRGWIKDCDVQIGKNFGANSFRTDRLSAAQRRERGMELSRRQYNRQFRWAQRLEDKLERLERNWSKYECVRLGKTRLATRLSREEFARDSNSAAFIAYYAARCNLRTRFTIMGQTKPFDEVAQMLFARCENRANTNWWAVAHLFPDAKVLARLSDEQKGHLLSQYFEAMREVAALLRETWEASNINRETMVVRRGNDSSTWNAAAVAWNRARDGWIGLLYALGGEEILDAICPGKVLVLVAGDLAWMHSAMGSGLHPDTFVWNELPLPWQVLEGQARCGRTEIEAVCRKHDVDTHKNDWSAPRPRAQAVAFSATPELVHGVTVSSPLLAKILREAGVFSGKNFKPQNLTF